MKWSLSLVLLVCLFSASVSCTRACAACAASWLPKLELRGQLTRTHDVGTQSERGRVQLGVGAWLRWQPVVAASYVPERFELSPSAFMAPCEADDTVCFAELAQDERELSSALQEAP